MEKLKLEDVRIGQSGEVPLTAATVPFILITSDTVYVAKNVTDKRDLLSKYKDGDTLLAPWPGQWSTDVFEVDVEMAKQLV